MFLAGPLVEELKEEVASSSPLDSRRMLELLVPLVYRPAMKVGHLSMKKSQSDGRNEGAGA